MKRNILITILLIIIAIFVYYLVRQYIPSIQPIGILSTQTELDLSGQGLTKVPDYVFEQVNLKVLNLSNNNLTGAIPGEIRFLTKLTSLDLSNNKMTGIPAEIGQLNNLIVLNLSNNELTGLPNELRNLKKLETFNISGNNYSQHDLEIIIGELDPEVLIIK